MSCGRCGSKKGKSKALPLPTFTAQAAPEDDMARIGAKASIDLDVNGRQITLAAGRTMTLSKSLANELVKMGAPIWVF